jgi:hypothetical protein
MLVGYEANNAMRNSTELGDYSRDLIEQMADKHVGDYRALLFSTRIKEEYSKYYSGSTNVSTYVPVGSATMLPSAWIRYKLNPLLQAEKVKVFHGLNEELPYGIEDNIKTVLTCYNPEKHNCNSLLDTLLWQRRMKYSFERADVIVAVSEEVKKQIVSAGVSESKIVVIPGMTITDEIVNRYWEIYTKLDEEEED